MLRGSEARVQLLSLRSGARGPRLLGPCATAVEAHVPRLLGPARLEPVLRSGRGHRNERPGHRDEGCPCWPRLKGARA